MHIFVKHLREYIRGQKDLNNEIAIEEKQKKTITARIKKKVTGTKTAIKQIKLRKITFTKIKKRIE